jgi:hypothetical protein
VIAAVLLVAVLIAAQALAAATAPPQASGAGRALGRAGFAYLGGVRTFAAAVILNGIDPQFHEYFGGSRLETQAFMVPKMRLATLLDPTFTDAYSVSSWIVFRRIGPEQGIAVAREGAQKNPASGEMKSNLVQLLFIHDKVRYRDEIMRVLESELSPSTTWASADGEYEGLASMKSALSALGRSDLAAGLDTRLEQLRDSGAGQGDHDHDGDGKQDH